MSGKGAEALYAPVKFKVQWVPIRQRNRFFRVRIKYAALGGKSYARQRGKFLRAVFACGESR
jgi:hypothetical protein